MYQWCADLQIPSPRNSANVGSVEKWVRANDMHCTCARRTGLQLHVSRRVTFCQSFASVCALNEALMRGPSASAEKNCGSESAVHCDRSPQDTGVWPMSSDGPCRFLKSTTYWYLWLQISVIPIISAIICLPIFTAR